MARARLRVKPCIWRQALSIATVALFAWHGDCAGTNCQEGLECRDKLKQDPALVRYYTFEDVVNSGSNAVNLAGAEGWLTYRDLNNKPGEPMAEMLRVVNGRFPASRAVYLDQCSLVADRLALDARSFTVACWFRYRGPGSIRVSQSECGPIVALGSGYSDGWRLLVDQRMVQFQLGNAKGPTTLSAHRILNDGQWHHVAIAAGDGLLRLRVDGAPAAQTAVAKPDQPEAGPLIIGYSGHGVGSVKLELDEVSIYNRSLSSEEIHNQALVK